MQSVQHARHREWVPGRYLHSQVINKAISRMQGVMRRFSVLLSALLLATSMFFGLGSRCLAQALPAEVAQALQVIAKVQPNGGGHAEAVQAAGQLSQLPPAQIVAVLEAFKGANPLAKNWLMGIVGAIARKHDNLPSESLERFLNSQANDADARYWVFEYLTNGKPELRSKWLESMTADTSLDIRYLAVAQKLESLKSVEKSDKLAVYRSLLEDARHPEQLKEITATLREAGEGVDLARQYGFLMSWKLVGPFDNRNEAGFDVIYAPEEKYLAAPGQMPAGKFGGKEGKELSWIDGVTDSDDGMLNINPLFNKEKGAIVYAFAEFDAAESVAADIRLGCINANKVWVNGQEVTSNKVYHAASSIDQYIGQAKLLKGKNTILIKVCQNEQTESWAQDWQFQLRVCDVTGKAILATDRVANPVKASAKK
jgi:hypothetical protein